MDEIKGLQHQVPPIGAMTQVVVPGGRFRFASSWFDSISIRSVYVLERAGVTGRSE